MTALIATGAGGSPAISSTMVTAPVTASTGIGLRRRSTRAAAPTSIRMTLRSSGLRVPKVGPSGPPAEANEPVIMQTSTARASTASSAVGWARSQPLARA